MSIAYVYLACFRLVSYIINEHLKPSNFSIIVLVFILHAIIILRRDDAIRVGHVILNTRSLKIHFFLIHLLKNFTVSGINCCVDNIWYSESIADTLFLIGDDRCIIAKECSNSHFYVSYTCFWKTILSINLSFC